MSKKHFIELANAIHCHNQNHDLPKFTKEHLETLASFCKGQNYAFMRGRWLAYIAGTCGPNGGEVKAR